MFAGLPLAYPFLPIWCVMSNVVLSCDYVTLSFRDFVPDDLPLPSFDVSSRRLQYFGRSTLEGDVFCGQSDNLFLVQASGGSAHPIFAHVLGYRPDYPGLIRLTRFDLKIDLPGFIPLSLDGCSFRSKDIITSVRDGVSLTTLYLGSRKSDFMWRIYHKIIDAVPFTRVELEVKGNSLDAWWLDTDISLVSFFGSRLSALIGRLSPSTLRSRLVEVAHSLPQATFSPTPSRFHDTRGWLLGVVATCLARVLVDDYAFLEQFNAQVERNLISGIFRE